MDAHCELILEEYRENQETFKIIQKIVEEKLNGFVKESGGLVNSITTRIKTEQSLCGKLDLKGTKYKTLADITDIVGARIVTFYSDEIEKYAAKLEQVFNVDWSCSVDKRKIYQVDQFGYMSLHYICSIPETLFHDDKFPLVNKYRFEIQLRSVLQHAWATIYHDTGYKNNLEVPREYLRSLNRLASLLELADQAFVDIRTGIDKYRRNVSELIKRGSINEIELNGDSYELYMRSGVFDKITERIATINNMEIENVSSRRYLRILKGMGYVTLGQLDADRKRFEDLAYQFAVRQYADMDIDIIASTTGLYMFIIVSILSYGSGVGTIEELLKFLHGDRKSNKTLATKIMDIGKSMGIGSN